MMYSEKIAVAIKVGGKVLRENKDLVRLPFGSEFSVLVKNLNSRRAKFKLHIDGTDVLDGEEIIVNANSDVEMKRFIRNGNMNEGNAFKFIERTAEIEDGPRGIKVDDGIVRVEVWFEQPQPEVYNSTIYRDVMWDTYRRHPTYSAKGISGTLQNSVDGLLGSARGIVSNDAGGGATATAVTTDVGITVPGSKVDQKFHAVYGFRAEANSHVIVMRLSGYSGTEPVAEAITVDKKPQCVTCGKMNKSMSNYCAACGTALALL